jgi:ABC-type sugar transport system permease subunit
VVDKLSDSLNERYITMQTWITGFFPTMALFGWFILTTYLYVFKEHGEIKILNIPILTHTQIIMLCLIGIKTWYVVTYLAAMISGGCK